MKPKHCLQREQEADLAVFLYLQAGMTKVRRALELEGRAEVADFTLSGTLRTRYHKN